MNDGRKMTALPYGEVRERLLSKRQDASGKLPCAYPPCERMFTPEDAHQKYCCPDHRSKARNLRDKDVLEERICAYAKCGVKFTPRRPDQIYHSADCRKRAWFDRNFVPIAKPPES